MCSGRTQVDGILARQLDAAGRPSEHPRADLVESVPPQDRRDGLDRLQAVAAIELVRATDVLGRMWLAPELASRPRGGEYPPAIPRRGSAFIASTTSSTRSARAGGRRPSSRRCRTRRRVARLPRRSLELSRAGEAVSLWGTRWPGDDPDVVVLGCERLADLQRPVGRSVVDEEQPVRRAGLRRHRAEERREVGLLVEVRDDHGDARLGRQRCGRLSHRASTAGGGEPGRHQATRSVFVPSARPRRSAARSDASSVGTVPGRLGMVGVTDARATCSCVISLRRPRRARVPRA